MFVFGVFFLVSWRVLFAPLAPFWGHFGVLFGDIFVSFGDHECCDGISGIAGSDGSVSDPTIVEFARATWAFSVFAALATRS